MIETLRKNLQNSDVTMGLGVIFILALIIIPLPGLILDALIALSLLSGMLILLTALSSRSPADFTVFPTLLLVTTIYRLAVNVSTTRMILTEGPSSSSAMIEAFGTFVVGGGGSMSSYVVGIIIFLILTLMQILVITKGATRVSEVAARFALDSLPGKQMAIDSDFSAGHIDEKEARTRREALQKEMAFYGAMDGSSKFVQGDVRLGLVMTAINIIGGLIVGISIRGESFSDALEMYTKLTIGDGLVSQIPVLLISTATGVVVSRSVGDGSFSDDMRNQLFANPRILYVTGAVLVAAGLIPGFPMIALFMIGGLLIYLGWQIEKNASIKEEQERVEMSEQSESKGPESFVQHLKTETLEVEVGYGLVPLVDPQAGGTLLDQVSRLRKRFAMESGLIVPPVRIRDNMDLKPGEYSIHLHGNRIAGFEIEPDKLMALDTGEASEPINGSREFREPTYNLKAFWIDPEQKSDAEASGYSVVDPSTVIATHLSNVIQNHAQEIMGREQVKEIVDAMREQSRVIVDEVLDEKKIPLGLIQAVLQNLLKEGVSIRNMTQIMEAISNNAEQTGRDPYLLTESVRIALRRQIAGEFADANGAIRCITLDPAIERRLREGIHRSEEEGFVMALKPEFQIALRDALAQQFNEARKSGLDRPVFLTFRGIRAGIFYIMERLFPPSTFAVLAHEEIPNEMNPEPVGTVTIQAKKEEEAAAH